MTSLFSFYSSFWRRKWQPTPVFLPGESHGRKGLVGYSLWGCKELDMTKQLTHTHTHTHTGGVVVKNPPANAGVSSDTRLIPGSGRSPGGGNGNPLQYSCLGNPLDRGSWWAAVCGVAESQTRLSTHWLAGWLWLTDKPMVCLFYKCSP